MQLGNLEVLTGGAPAPTANVAAVHSASTATPRRSPIVGSVGHAGCQRRRLKIVSRRPVIGYVEAMQRVLVLFAVLASTAAAPALAATRPPAGARYSGTTGQGKRISLRVTTTRRAVQLRFAQVQTCSNGQKKASTAVFEQMRPTLKADGTFAYAKTFKDLAAAPGFDEVHTEVQNISGSFSPDGRTAKGRISDTVTGASGLSCKVVMRFTARRR